MRLLKVFIAFIMVLITSGCVTTTSNYYVLSMVEQPKTHYKSPNHVIGVEKITVPGYLYKRDIAIAKSSNQIVLLGNALWGEDLDTGLTERLIGYLQKKFNLPDVYAYPWGLDKRPDIKISVHITRFIAQDSYVYLDVTWRIEESTAKRSVSKLFNTRVKTKEDVNSIVNAMNLAFSKFEESVALELRKF